MLTKLTTAATVFGLFSLCIACTTCATQNADTFDDTPHVVKESSIVGTPLSKSCSQKVQKGQLSGKVDVVVAFLADGDTFTACTADATNLSVKVRLYGVDCPETHYNDKCERDGHAGRKTCEEQIPLGRLAMQKVMELIKGKKITLEPSKIDGGYKFDDFDRVLSYVRLDNGEDLGKKLISEGFCDDFSWKYRHPRMDEYRAAQANRPH
jgi:endonuclease YncB( thermonuclease family)